MNTEQYKKNKHRLDLKLDSDFNLNAVYRIRELLGDRHEFTIDLERARFVNSEAVIYLHELIRSGRHVRVKNPPKTFYEILHILGLHEEWDLNRIVQ